MTKLFSTTTQVDLNHDQNPILRCPQCANFLTITILELITTRQKQKLRYNLSPTSCGHLYEASCQQTGNNSVSSSQYFSKSHTCGMSHICLIVIGTVFVCQSNFSWSAICRKEKV